jgi:hypothetical protein
MTAKKNYLSKNHYGYKNAKLDADFESGEKLQKMFTKSYLHKVNEVCSFPLLVL